MNERTQEELRELANKYNGAVNEIKDLTDKLKVWMGFLNSLLKCYNAETQEWPSEGRAHVVSCVLRHSP